MSSPSASASPTSPRRSISRTLPSRRSAGAHLPTSGTVSFDGHDITAATPYERSRLGMSLKFQITAVLPGFSVLENAALAVQARSGHSFRFWRAAATEAALNNAALDALAQVGLAARAETLAGDLSHGERRQLELAIALAMQPRLLLLDEPLAGAGTEETERLVGILAGLKARYGIVLVEHDMPMAATALVVTGARAMRRYHNQPKPSAHRLPSP